VHGAAMDATHRPWPLPRRPWAMAQTWRDLLFAHWSVPPAALGPLLPGALAPDTRDGMAWVGVVPFRMTDIHLRGLPPIPGLSAFPELNVRTYVTFEGKPGVWFPSLDATNVVAVEVARRWFQLPYVRARMSWRAEGDGVDYASERTDRRLPLPADLRVRYGPTSPPEKAVPGSLVHWLTERYCLYTVDARGSVLRGDIHHAPWTLQRARADFTENTMATAAGIALPTDRPLLHFARHLDVVLWNLEVVQRAD
jgi:uncharacterized protein YqjF (DUF2071 family)